MGALVFADPKQKRFDFDGPSRLLSPDDIYENATEELLARVHEDRRIEWKVAGIHAEPLGPYFSMWANTVPDGGIIAIGVQKDGVIIGCNSLSESRLSDLERSGRTYCPDARYQTKRVPAINPKGERDFVLLIRVFYKPERVAETTAGEAYARFGGSKHQLSREEIRELQISKGQIDFEKEPSTLVYPRDFDTALVREFATAYKKMRNLSADHDDPEILVQRKLGRFVDGQFEPNNACTLMFAKDPTTEFPGCKIRFLRFDGDTEKVGAEYNLVKDIWIDGLPVPRLIQEAEKVISSQLRDFSRLGKDGKFYTAPEYPRDVWYEAIVNACMHRSYHLRTMTIFVKMFDSKLIVESPGGFPGFVSPENIYSLTCPRNPHLMEAMYFLEFVKCANEGTRRMKELMERGGLPQPEFEQKQVQNVSVSVTLRNNVKLRTAWVDKDASDLVGKSLWTGLTEHEKRAIINRSIKY